MMKKSLIILLLPIACYSQKIMIDKTDPFTRDRMIATDNAKISIEGGLKIQANISATIKKDGTKYWLGFITQKIIFDKMDSPDSVVNSCFIRFSDGETIEGVWGGSGDVEMPMIGLYTSASFHFTESQFRKLADNKITDIKITGSGMEGLFSLKEKNQDRIARYCKFLLIRLATKS